MFKTSCSPACTLLAICYQWNMAKFCSTVGISAKQFSTNNHGTTYSCTYSNEHYIRHPLAGTETCFTKSHHIGIIANQYRKACLFLYDIRKMYIFPSLDILCTTHDNTRCRIYYSGSSYTYAVYIKTLRSSICFHFIYCIQNLTYDCISRYISLRRDTSLKMKYAFIINQGVFHRRTAKVYSYSVPFHIKLSPPI